MAMNDENCPPQELDANLSMSSVKAGAAVFGNLVFGSECPEHSLCYSPSPLFNRRNDENVLQQPVDGKVLRFDISIASPKKPQDKAPPKKTESSKVESKTEQLKRKGPKGKVVPHRKNRGGYKQQTTNADMPAGSINPFINGVRRSKEVKLKENMASVAELREQRRREREEVAAFNVEAEQTRREVIELKKKLNERFRQAKITREQTLRDERLAKIENEINFKSQVHVDHKRTLKEQEDMRRRMSIAARAKQRQNRREGEEKLRLQAIQEDQTLYEERHESSAAMRKTKVDNAEKRRVSFAFRNGDARRIRELFAQKEAERLNQDHESYELKWAGERDADDYKKQMAQQRRDSFAFRNAEGKRIRDLEDQMKANALHDEHESYELKWAGEQDAEDYKKQMAQERRDSFAFSNAEGRRIRDIEAQMKADVQHNEHESYELKWAGERDADEYKKQMAQERRESFAFRNAEGQRIRTLEAQLKVDNEHDEHESYELKWAGERDADDYKKQMAQERRDSFAFRNAEGSRIRDLEAQMKADAQQDEHMSYELKWAGERDADNYKNQMAQERGDSFAFRNAEGSRIRNLEAQMKVDAEHDEHESYELKWAGKRDADEYKKQMAQERRDSFAFRNAEGKRIRDIEGQMKADELHYEHESYELKWAGERDADDYKKQMTQERRDSFAFRNAEGKRIRDLEAQMKADAQQDEHMSYELKWAGERDANEYKKQMAQERRESFAFRNAEGRRIRDLEGQMKTNAEHDEHESYELKWAGERDANDYKKKMAQERRDSLKFRNQEAARHDAVMKELLNLAQEREHESYMLKWAGENDAKKYLADQRELHRQSLAFRNAEGRRHRDIDEEVREQKNLENARNEELNAACHRDVQNYIQECADRDRASLCLRGKEHFSQRMKAENEKELKMQEDHESHLLDAAAWQDVNDYVKECNRRKRLSLAFRAKEKRHHFKIEREQAELKIHQQHLDTQLRSEDARYIEMARLKERARVALESFNWPPTCSFGANPFATLLG